MWLVILGLAGAVIAEIVRWIDVRSLPPGSKVRDDAVRHGKLDVVAALWFAISLVARRAHLSDLASGTPISAMIASALGLVVLLPSVWLGYVSVFSRGAQVASSDQLPLGDAHPAHPATAAARRRHRAGG
jgi:uncharacterized membrane protein